MIEALAHAGIPTIPVKVWHEGGRWKKEPSLVKWPISKRGACRADGILYSPNHRSA